MLDITGKYFNNLKVLKTIPQNDRKSKIMLVLKEIKEPTKRLQSSTMPLLKIAL